MKKIEEFMKTTHWSKVPAKEKLFFAEIERVFPDYQALIVKETNSNGSTKHLTKTAVMKGSLPISTSLPKFIQQLKALSEGCLVEGSTSRAAACQAERRRSPDGRRQARQV